MGTSAASKMKTSRGGQIGIIYEPDREWLRKQPVEPALEPDLPIIDTHHHLWDRGSGYYVEDLLADIDGGHNVIATVTSECHMAYRKEGPDEMKPVGETEFIVRLIEQHYGDKTKVGAGIVGFANLLLGDNVEPVLQAHIEAANGRFRGIRYTTTWDPSKKIGHRGVPQVLAQPNFRAGLARVGALGLVFDAWVFHTQLPELTDLARAFPDIPIVCCHAGGQLGYGPYTDKSEDVRKAWKAGMKELATCPNVTVKLGGLMMRLASFDYTTAPVPPSSAELARLWEPTIGTCLELFGADRCMFESNFPVDKMGTGYTVLWNAFKVITKGASPSEKTALYSGTARRVYKV